jgi:hypothetical protein
MRGLANGKMIRFKTDAIILKNVFVKRVMQFTVVSARAQFIPTGARSDWNVFRKAGAIGIEFEELRQRI